MRNTRDVSSTSGAASGIDNSHVPRQRDESLIETSRRINDINPRMDGEALHLSAVAKIVIKTAGIVTKLPAFVNDETWVTVAAFYGWSEAESLHCRTIAPINVADDDEDDDDDDDDEGNDMEENPHDGEIDVSVTVLAEVAYNHF